MTDENIPAGLPREAAPARWLIGFGVAVAGLTLFSHLAGRHARKRVPPDGGFLDVDGTNIHYSDTGQGPAIVMIHGLGGQMRNFSYALSARLADRYRVILIDRPGAGYSSKQARAKPSLAEQARIIAGALRQLGLVQPLVVGHSLGGAVALTLALDNPGLLSGLALIAPLTQTPNVHPVLKTSLVRSRVLHHLIGRTIAVPMLVALGGRRQQSRVFAPDPVPPRFDIDGGGLLLRNPAMLAAAFGDAAGLVCEMPRLVVRYPTLDLPVDILFGRQDGLLDPEQNGSLTASQIEGARLTLTDGGHMVPVTQPDMVAKWIAQAH